MLLLLGTTIGFASMHAVIRIASSEQHPFEAAFFRNLFGLVFISPLLLRHGFGALRTRKLPLHPPGANFTETLKADLDQIVQLDALGYSEVWIGEHFTSEWENIPAPNLLIAQAIPLTEQIRLGTGVSCIPNHDPFVLAHRIAQLDHIAEGRFNWGVGTGSFPGDMKVFGY